MSRQPCAQLSDQQVADVVVDKKHSNACFYESLEIDRMFSIFFMEVHKWRRRVSSLCQSVDLDSDSE